MAQGFAAGGESNSGTNAGAGAKVFKQKAGENLQFRTLTGGDDITVTEGANEIDFDVVSATAATASTLAKRDASGQVNSFADVVTKSAAYTVASGDSGKIHHCSGTFTVTLPSAIDGFQMTFMDTGTGVITFASASTIKSKDAAVTLATQYTSAVVWSDGTSWFIAGDLA